MVPAGTTTVPSRKCQKGKSYKDCCKKCSCGCHGSKDWYYDNGSGKCKSKSGQYSECCGQDHQCR